MNVQTTSIGMTQARSRRWPRLILALIVLGVMFAPLPTGGDVPRSRTLRISAGQYEYSPGIISVNEGDLVTIELVSTDVVHGLYLDSYNLEVTADPGRTASLTFVADKPGTFRFRCPVACGPLHPFMIGKLRVGNNTLWWRGMALAVVAAVAGLWRLRQ